MELNGRAYTVMAVVYPLNPVTQLTVQQGAGDKFNLSFIIPSEVFRQQWPDHTLRKMCIRDRWSTPSPSASSSTTMTPASTPGRSFCGR